MNQILNKPILSILICILFSTCTEINGSDSIVNKVTISNLKTQINIESKTWGLAGNHEIIQLTSMEKCDTIKFYTDQIFYTTRGNDTLVIYTNSSSYSEKPKSICGNIHLDINDLNSYDEIKELERTYQKMKLKRITIYKK